MEEKIFSLLEQMYSEINKRFDNLEKKVEDNSKHIQKLEIGQEQIQKNIQTITEAQQMDREMNEKAHAEIIRRFDDRISTVENAVKYYASEASKKLDEVKSGQEFLAGELGKQKLDIDWLKKKPV